MDYLIVRLLECVRVLLVFDVDAIPHVLCGGFTKEETEYLLVDCHYLAIDNLVALRGDPMKGEKYFVPAKGGNAYAIDLVKQIKQMNDGNFLHGNEEMKHKPVPIIPGIKPVAVKRHLQILPQVFWLDMPKHLISEIENAKDNKAVRQVGIEFAIQQSKELMEYGVPCLHYYSMGKSDNIKAIAEGVF